MLNDGVNQGRAFFEEPPLEADGMKQLEVEGSLKTLKWLAKELAKNPWDGVDMNKAKGLVSKSAELAEVKKGLVMKSLRAALLGSMKGPDLLTTWSLLARIGQDLNRINRCF